MIECIKQLTELEAIELIDCAKDGRVERAKEIIGQAGNDGLKNVGDKAVHIRRAIKYALYRDSFGSQPIYYVPVLVPDDKLAFCVRVY